MANLTGEDINSIRKRMNLVKKEANKTGFSQNAGSNQVSPRSSIK